MGIVAQINGSGHRFRNMVRSKLNVNFGKPYQDIVYCKDKYLKEYAEQLDERGKDILDILV